MLLWSNPPESQQNYTISLTWNEHPDYFLVTYHYDMLWSGTQPADSGSGAFSLDGGWWMGSWDLSQMVQMGYLNPSSDQALYPPGDHSVMALAPMMLQSHSTLK